MNIKVLTCLATVLFFLGFKLDAQIQNLNLSMVCQNVAQGRDVCIKFKTSTIQQLEAIQFSINYDPTVLQVVGNASPGVCLPLLSSSNIINFGNGKISFLWFNDPVDVTDCEMFSICFKFIGDPGKKTTISYANSPTEISADSPLGPVNIIPQSCSIEVLPNGQATIASYCQPTTKGGNDGSIKFYGIGGVGPYTYNLINNTSGSSIKTGSSADKEEINLTGIPEGNYTITIVDGTGIAFPPKAIPMIDGGSNPKFELEVFNPSCYRYSNGLIRIKKPIMGTFVSPKIEWSTGSFNIDSLDNLGNGKYSVSVTDDNGCVVSKDTTLNRDTLQVSYTITQQALCNNAGDNAYKGEIVLKVNGGIPFPGGGYRFVTGNSNTFLGPVTTPLTLPRIAGGNTLLKIRDNGLDAYGRAAPCEVQQMIRMPYRDTIKYSNLTNNPVQCKGEGNGSMEVTFSGNGTGEYRIIREWNETLGTVVVPSGGLISRTTYLNRDLKAGNYYVITESTVGQCRDTFRYTINEAIIPLRVTPTVTQPSCSTFGSIRVAPAGGQPPYTYVWENSNTTNTRNNLNPGTYNVTVTDFNKCDTVFNFVLTSTSTNKVAKASIIAPVSCFNSATGAATVDLDSAAYVWQNSLGVVVGNTKSVSNLTSGSYYVTVTKDGCISQDSIMLTNPASMVFDSIQSTLPQCAKGGNKGSIGAILSGGEQPYSYEWKNVGGTVISTQSVLTSIDAGSYSLTVKDQSGCTRDTTVSLKAPNPIVVSLIGNAVDISCFGDSTGSAFVMASGGTILNNTRYKFFWSTGAVSSGLFDRDLNSKLSAGRQWAIAGDGTCLSDTFFINITQREKITLAKTIKGICGSACEGKVDLLPSGGTGALSIRFNGNQLTTDSVSNLCKGKYPITIFDALGCSITDSAVIDINDSISLAINPDLTQNLSCKVAKGSIAVLVNGGNPTYTYKWSNNVSSTTSLATNLDQGNYIISVSDANGCSNSLSYSLQAPDSIRAVIAEPKAPKCFGGGSCIEVLSVTGGIGNKYTMQINNGLRVPVDSCINLIEGKYLVSIFDADGCKSNYNISIPGAEQIIVELGENQSISLGEDINEIIPTITGASNSTIIYSWSGIGSLSYRDTSLKNSVIGKPSDNLFITLKIVDENGCSTSDNLAIEVTRARNVFIPNIIMLSSINEENKKFDIEAGFGIELVEELIILDRWGNKVFNNNNYVPDADSGWDGTLNGTALNPGVFVYAARVRFIDGEIKYYKGDITLLK